MGTTSEKLTYLNQTKQKLKQAINNIGGEVTDETTFREYVAELENAYDRLPKTSFQTGTDVTLENCLKGKLDYENGVVGIGQSSQESTTGKNDFNITNYNSNYFSNNNATNIVKTQGEISFTSNARFYGLYIATGDISNVIDDLDANATYYISIDIEVNANNSFYLGSTTKQVINLNAGKQRISVATKINEAIIFYNFSETGTFNYKISKIMISKDNDTTFEPYTNGASPNPSYPQQIKSVTGTQNVVVSGKNGAKLDQSINDRNADITYTENVANNVVGSKTSNNGQFLATFVAQVVNGQSYIISGTESNCGLYVYKETLGGESFMSISNANLPVAITSNYTGTIVLGLYIPSLYSGTASIHNFQLEQGNQATTYEPYITPTTYQFSLGDHKFYGIGDYADELIYDVDEDKVYKNEKIGKKVFTGASDENWIFAQVAGGTLNAFSIQTSDIEINNILLANYYKGVLVVDRADNTIYSKNVNNTNYIDIINNSISSANDFKTWLSTHNTKVRYILTTPVETEITDTTLKAQVKAWYNAHSNNGTTIITSNGNLPMIIKVRALKGE